MPRALVVGLAALAACGRLGFQPPAKADTPPADTAPPADAALPALCAPSVVFDAAATLGTGDTATDVRVAPFAGGYALAIGTAALDVYALHLDANLDAAEPAAHLPLPGAYTLWSAVATPSYAYVFVGDTDGTGYLKRLENNFDAYSVAQNVGKFPSDPALAPLGAAYLLGAVDGSGKLDLFTVDAGGATGSITVATHPAATAVSLAPAPGGVEAALAGSPCETVLVDATGAAAAPHVFAPSCGHPFVVADVVAYEAGGQVIAHAIPTDPAAPGADAVLGTGRAPRIVRTATGYVAAWLSDGGTLALAVADGASGPRLTTTTIPATSFDLIAVQGGVVVVWLDGTAIHRAQVCTA